MPDISPDGYRDETWEEPYSNIINGLQTNIDLVKMVV